MLNVILAGIVGYLIGSVPPGYLYLRWFRKVDVRNVASGRTGATNTFRAGGLWIGILTGFSDIFKGALAVIAVTAIFGNVLTGDLLHWARALSGVAAVVGHNWSIYLGFRGGAGTTPNIGWAAAVWWPGFVINVIVGSALLRFLGIASVASMVVAVLIPVTFGILYAVGVLASPAYLLAGVVTALLVFWALRPNIQRLLDGTERIIGPRARRQAREEARRARESAESPPDA